VADGLRHQIAVTVYPSADIKDYFALVRISGVYASLSFRLEVVSTSGVAVGLYHLKEAAINFPVLAQYDLNWLMHL
jgi:hypothetical protein